MTTKESLGIQKLDCMHFYVRDLDRTSNFLTKKMDFQLIGGSSLEMEERGKQRSRVFRAGEATFVVSMPVGEGGRASRYLRQHPEGVGAIVFEVEDIEKTFKLLDERGAALIDDIQRSTNALGGSFATFSTTTPFGSTTFRFVQRDQFDEQYPGFVLYDTPEGGTNTFGFTHIDHITSNFQTMKPALLWMEHVMGMEAYWDVEFHTIDIDPSKNSGSGLKSVVMWDPNSGLKFANNEPRRPFFKSSQINVFGSDQRGDGVQHAALVTGDIIGSVRTMRKRGVEFMPTPGSYYDMLPKRIEELGIVKIDEDLDVLRDLKILVDGGDKESYMLQIFLKEAAGLHRDPEAGPFFFEVIQRKGDRGFGAGNFRALFESIEREQRKEGRI